MGARSRLALCYLLFTACGGQPASGTEGGPCYGNETCNDGLICLSQLCVQPPTPDAGGMPDAVPETSASTPDPELGGGPGCDSIPWGEAIGDYRGVTAYSNANYRTACSTTDCACTGCTADCCGIEWQCVEYVERFYNALWSELTSERGLPTDPSTCSLRGSGNAKDLLGTSTSCGSKLSRFQNGDSAVPPRRDDIIVWGPSAACPSTDCNTSSVACACGHTGIVNDLQYNQTGDVVGINVISQNFGNNSCDASRSFLVTRDNTTGNYSVGVGALGAQYMTLGWMGLGGTVPSIEVTHPNGGDTWIEGQTYNVEWSSTNVAAPLRIVARKSGLEIAPTISTTASATGTQTVVVPVSWAAGNDYEICVTANNGTVADCTPTFSVIAPSACSFTDPQLEGAVRSALGIPSGPISATGASTLTSLDASNRSISSLDGIGCLSSLQTLNISGNNISDVSPVAALPVRDLVASNNSIADITALGTMSTLTYVDLQSNQVAAIPVMSEVQTLLLAHNSVTNISGTSGMPNLSVLNLNFNQIASGLSALESSGLAAGDFLYIQQNPFDCTAEGGHLTTLVGRGVNVSDDCGI